MEDSYVDFAAGDGGNHMEEEEDWDGGQNSAATPSSDFSTLSVPFHLLAHRDLPDWPAVIEDDYNSRLVAGFLVSIPDGGDIATEGGILIRRFGDEWDILADGGCGDDGALGSSLSSSTGREHAPLISVGERLTAEQLEMLIRTCLLHDLSSFGGGASSRDPASPDMVGAASLKPEDAWAWVWASVLLEDESDLASGDCVRLSPVAEHALSRLEEMRRSCGPSTSSELRVRAASLCDELRGFRKALMRCHDGSAWRREEGEDRVQGSHAVPGMEGARGADADPDDQLPAPAKRARVEVAMTPATTHGPARDQREGPRSRLLRYMNEGKVRTDRVTGGGCAGPVYPPLRRSYGRHA